MLLEQADELQSLSEHPATPERLNQFREVMLAFATRTPNKVDVPGYCEFGTIFDKRQGEMKPVKKTVYSWKKIISKLVAHLQGVPSVTGDEMMTWNAASVG